MSVGGPISVHIVGGGIPWWSIGGIAAAAVVGFGAAFVGGWMQRKSTRDALELQLQIDAAAKFIAAVGDFTVGYANSNKLGVEDLTPTERDEPAYFGFIALNSQAAAVAIVGPDELALLADRILERALDAGFDHGTDGVAAYTEMGRLTGEFRDEARKLRPTARQKNCRTGTSRQKNGRSQADSTEKGGS